MPNECYRAKKLDFDIIKSLKLVKSVNISITISENCYLKKNVIEKSALTNDPETRKIETQLVITETKSNSLTHKI